MRPVAGDDEGRSDEPRRPPSRYGVSTGEHEAVRGGIDVVSGAICGRFLIRRSPYARLTDSDESMLVAAGRWGRVRERAASAGQCRRRVLQKISWVLCSGVSILLDLHLKYLADQPSEAQRYEIYHATIDDPYGFVSRRCDGARLLREDVTQKVWLRAVRAWRRSGLPVR
jgi:hypothetical protein